MGKHSVPDVLDWFDEMFSGKNDKRRSPDGNCYGFEDGMDGFVVHGEGCSAAGQGWTNGSDCINYSTWRGSFPDWTER